MTDTIGRMEVVDAHCHPISEKDAATTPEEFLGRISLSGFTGDGQVDPHFKNTVFVRFLTKEMAQFLGCEPVLEAVIEARNERGRDYAGYINALFEDAGIAEVLIDTGYVDGLDADGVATFAAAIAPTRARYLVRVETITDELFATDLTYSELRDRFVERVRKALDGTDNLGQRSVGMKSYLLPDVGVIRPEYDDNRAAASWALVRDQGEPEGDRAAQLARGQVLRERLLTLAMEECLARDMPMQFHAGDGEPPYVILRNQDPFYLEEIIRFEKDGKLRMPKVVPVHAGYPLVGQAAWLSHIYRNTYFELSTMTPLIHQRLAERYQEILEVAPLSKILYGSDAFHLPELFWISARWGKRYLAQALTSLAVGGALDEEEALDAARMILHRNTREAYNLGR
jgi:predicted TIM-barrel fold metal-dependent hydrolase